MTRTIALLGLVALSTGCTALQLKRSTIRQSETLSDIYQQQVLDNLAKFVHNAGATPDFAVPNQGLSQVTDDLNQGGSELEFDPVGFSSAKLGLPSGQRSVNQSWTLDPIRDPGKLALMRCAYQKAVAGCCPGADAGCGPDCGALLDAFYGIRSDGKNLPSAATLAKRAALEPAECWFRTGGKHDLPKNCACLPVGHYCGTYVWVPPEGRARLSNLVLAVLDFAFNEPAVPPTKEVTAYFDKDGNLAAKQGEAAIVVTATLDLSTPLNGDRAHKLLFKGEGDGTNAPGPVIPGDLNRLRGGAGVLELRQQLDRLNTRPRR